MAKAKGGRGRAELLTKLTWNIAERLILALKVCFGLRK